MRIAFCVFLCVEILLDVVHAINNKLYSDAADSALIHNKAIICIGAVYRLAIEIACSCIYIFLWPFHTITKQPACWLLTFVCGLVVVFLVIAAVCRFKYIYKSYPMERNGALIRFAIHLVLLGTMIPVTRSLHAWFDNVFIVWIGVYIVSYPFKYYGVNVDHKEKLLHARN
jgi:hypothetical protein